MLRFLIVALVGIITLSIFVTRDIHLPMISGGLGATPTPTPKIVFFTVNTVSEGDTIKAVPSEDDIPTYEVQALMPIRLAWRVENPVVEVRLTDSQNDYGVFSPEDEFQVTITQSAVFQLSVTGGLPKRLRINVP